MAPVHENMANHRREMVVERLKRRFETYRHVHGNTLMRYNPAQDQLYQQEADQTKELREKIMEAKAKKQTKKSRETSTVGKGPLKRKIDEGSNPDEPEPKHDSKITTTSAPPLEEMERVFKTDLKPSTPSTPAQPDAHMLIECKQELPPTPTNDSLMNQGAFQDLACGMIEDSNADDISLENINELVDNFPAELMKEYGLEPEQPQIDPRLNQNQLLVQTTVSQQYTVQRPPSFPTRFVKQSGGSLLMQVPASSNYPFHMQPSSSAMYSNPPAPVYTQTAARLQFKMEPSGFESGKSDTAAMTLKTMAEQHQKNSQEQMLQQQRVDAYNATAILNQRPQQRQRHPTPLSSVRMSVADVSVSSTWRPTSSGSRIIAPGNMGGAVVVAGSSVSGYGTLPITVVTASDAGVTLDQQPSIVANYVKMFQDTEKEVEHKHRQQQLMLQQQQLSRQAAQQAAHSFPSQMPQQRFDLQPTLNYSQGYVSTVTNPLSYTRPPPPQYPGNQYQPRAQQFIQHLPPDYSNRQMFQVNGQQQHMARAGLPQQYDRYNAGGYAVLTQPSVSQGSNMSGGALVGGELDFLSNYEGGADVSDFFSSLDSNNMPNGNMGAFLDMADMSFLNGTN